MLTFCNVNCTFLYNEFANSKYLSGSPRTVQIIHTFWTSLSPQTALCLLIAAKRTNPTPCVLPYSSFIILLNFAWVTFFSTSSEGHYSVAVFAQSFSPSVFFSRNSPTSLSISARKCTSLNLSLTGCLGPNDRMWSKLWNFTGIHYHNFSTGAIPQLSILSLSLSLSDSLSSFPLSLFWASAEWLLISRLMLLTTDGISLLSPP